jgi:hypothetical protein
MVSPKLIHQIDDHSEQVSGRFLRLLRNSQDLPDIARLTENEVTELCRRALTSLSNWLVSSSESGLAWTYEKAGAERLRQGIPLSEAIRAIQFIKDATVSFIQDESIVENSVDVYSEEEFENHLGRFFDLVIYHLARGYENAAHANAHAARAGGR